MSCNHLQSFGEFCGPKLLFFQQLRGASFVISLCSLVRLRPATDLKVPGSSPGGSAILKVNLGFPVL